MAAEKRAVKAKKKKGITASICGGNFDLMEHAVDLLSESDKAYREALDTLKSVKQG